MLVESIAVIISAFNDNSYLLFAIIDFASLLASAIFAVLIFCSTI
jgi:hypothetical protein